MELSRLILGSQKWIFELDASIYYELLDLCWLRTMWEFVSKNKIEIRAPYVRMHPPRATDTTFQCLTSNDFTDVAFICRCSQYQIFVMHQDIVYFHSTRMEQSCATEIGNRIELAVISGQPRENQESMTGNCGEKNTINFCFTPYRFTQGTTS